VATDEVLVRGVASAIEPFRNLLEAFVDGRLSASDFQAKYLQAYLGDQESDYSFDVFNVVDRFFAEVDAYVDDERLRDPTEGDLGPDELRERARLLLRRAGFSYRADRQLPDNNTN
jgi:predicted Ser/Thr protein kinase